MGTEYPLMVSVSGMYGTGSSALLSLLSECDLFRIIPGETKLFESGLAELCVSLMNGHDISSNIDRTERNMLTYGSKKRAYTRLGCYVDRVVNTNSGNVYPQGYAKVFPLYYRAVQDFFHDLRELDPQKARDIDRVSILKNFFQVLLGDLSLNDGQIPVLDQLVKPIYPVLSSAIPFAKVIVVTRDPRDQFCDIIRNRLPWRRKPQFNLPAGLRCQRFVAEYRKRLKAADAFFEATKYNKNIMHCRFEDLALNTEQEYERIVRFCTNLDVHQDVNLQFARTHSSFDRERAQSRIGLYKRWAFRKEIELIEMELEWWV